MKSFSKFLVLAILFFQSCQSSKQLLFSSSREGNADIFLLDLSSQQLTQVTKGEQEEWGPSWKSKSQITFLRQDGKSVERYVHDLATGLEKRIPQPEQCVLDDKNMLYGPKTQRQLYVCDQNIYVADSKGRYAQNITKELSGISNYPIWTRNERQVLFTNNHSGFNDVYTFNLETAQVQNLTNRKGNDERGDLSPNGKWLAYSSNQFDAEKQDILIKNLKSGQIERITKGRGNALIARWSVNGKTLFYGSNHDGNWEIYAYSIKAKTTKRLTNHPGFDGDPRLF